MARVGDDHFDLLLLSQLIVKRANSVMGYPIGLLTALLQLNVHNSCMLQTDWSLLEPVHHSLKRIKVLN